MTGKLNARRRFLQGTLALIPLATLASVGTPGALAEGHSQPSAKEDDYLPRFFTADEWAFIMAACERLIPTDDLGPGAVTCGIPEFIDRQMETPYAYGALFYRQGPFITDQAPELGYQGRLVPRDILRLGIAACNRWCQRVHDRPFSKLDEPSQVEVLQRMEAGNLPMNEQPSSLFFNQLLKHTKEGYLADPLYGGNRDMAGWKMLGFPGARADFMDWIDRPGERYPLGPVSITGKRG